jgi:hypothetical protein
MLVAFSFMGSPADQCTRFFQNLHTDFGVYELLFIRFSGRKDTN